MLAASASAPRARARVDNAPCVGCMAKARARAGLASLFAGATIVAHARVILRLGWLVLGVAALSLRHGCYSGARVCFKKITRARSAQLFFFLSKKHNKRVKIHGFLRFGIISQHRRKIACQAAIFSRAVHTPVRSRPTSPLLAAFGACSVYTCPVYLLLRKLARSRGGLGQQCIDHRLGRLAGHYRDIYQWNYPHFASAYEGEAFHERRPEPACHEVVKQAYCKLHIASSPFGRGL